jgi:YVTN family beta-propeller protein
MRARPDATLPASLLLVLLTSGALPALAQSLSDGAQSIALPSGQPALQLSSKEGSREALEATWLAPRPAATTAAQIAARLHSAGAESTPPGAGDATEALVASFLSVNQDPEGDMPRELAFLPDGSAAVVVNRDTDTVCFFDVAGQSVTHTVAVGDCPVHVAVTPDGLRAGVPNVLDDTVSVIDVPSHSVLATIPVTGSQPYRVAITSDGLRALVGVINDGISSTFSVIDLVGLTETASFPSAPQGAFGSFFTFESAIFGNIFTQFALAPDDQTIVQPDRGGDRVVLWNLDTGALLNDLPTPGGPTAVDISADGTLAVVSHEFGNNRLTKIDLVTKAVTSFVTGNLQNQVVRLTPDASHALAAISNNVVFVNLTTGATTATLFTGTVGDIELSFDGQYAFVSSFNARVISLASQSIVATMTFAACAESAASPTEARAIALNNRFREDIHLYGIAGAAGSLQGWVPTGVPVEADAPRTVAVASDGLTAVLADNVSRNVTILDLPTGSVRGYADAGDRPLGVAISPDGGTAVVCNGDDDTVSIIDLAAGARVANLAVASRPAEVVISPDSQTAYVSSIAGTDRVHFIDLDGAASVKTGSLVAGQMGSVIYTYNVVSGMALSPDGSVLAVCISFDDELLLIDGVAHAEIARVPVGDFPIRVAFSPDGGTAWVVNAFGDSVSVVDIAGAGSSVVGTVTAIEFPLTVNVDPAGSHVYVGNFDGNAPRMHAIDTTTNLKVANVPLSAPSRAAHLSPLDGSLYVSTTGGELQRLSAAGAATTVLESEPLTLGAPDMAFSESLRVAVVTQPGADDGADLVDASLDVWTDLGAALAGAHGDPLLVGAGTLQPGDPVSLALSNALAGSSYTLVIGASLLNLPFKGGTMVPDTDLLIFGLPVLASPSGAAGFSQLSATWPALPSGISIYLQAWISDPAGPFGFAASNAVRGITP